MNPLDLVRLTPLMDRTRGRPQVKIGLIDGPVHTSHPELSRDHIQEIGGNMLGACNSIACHHATFIAGILCAKRGSLAPAICPDCTLVTRPIFTETALTDGQIPSATPEELATAIIECVASGAQLINLSLAVSQPSHAGERQLKESLDFAAMRGVIIVAASGNHATVGSSMLTRHQCVIPVVAYDLQARPMNYSNLAKTTGSRGLGAPGDSVTSLGPERESLTFGGTSVATPFLTGALALLWSEFPNSTAAELKMAIRSPYAAKRPSIVPPLLDAWRAYQFLVTTHTRRSAA